MESGELKVSVGQIGFSNEKGFVPGCINSVRTLFDSTSGSPALRGAVAVRRLRGR